MAMKINTEIIDKVPVITVEGRVSATNSLNFISSLKALTAHDSNTIILDLTKTTFIDSAAVGSICAVHIERLRNGKKLEIMVDPTKDNFIENLFETTGLKKVLNIIKSR